MTKRICYIHVGPHKTGTSAIQWFLQENRAELLEHGYFVPESETKRGAHHALAEKLAGMEVGEHREPLVGADHGPKFLPQILPKSLRLTTSRCAGQIGSPPGGSGGLFARSSKSCMRSFWIGRLPSTRLGMMWHVVADWFQKNRSRVTSSGAFEKT